MKIVIFLIWVSVNMNNCLQSFYTNPHLHTLKIVKCCQFKICIKLLVPPLGQGDLNTYEIHDLKNITIDSNKWTEISKKN